MRYLLLLLASILAGQPQAEEASVSGQVLHALTGQPLRKAKVYLAGPGTGLSDMTDSEGRFHFTGLPIGSYSLHFSRPGFMAFRLRPSFTLRQAQAFTSPPIRLTPQASISGRVLDEDGDPVGYARIRLLRQIFRQGRKQFEDANFSLTNPLGEYAIYDLPPGRYLLQATNTDPVTSNRFGPQKDGKLNSVSTYYPSTPDQQEAIPLDLKPGDHLNRLEVRLVKLPFPKTVTVSGKVVGPMLDSQTEYAVSAAPSALHLSSGVGTSAKPPDYSFHLALVPGRYTLVANRYSTTGAEAYAAMELTVTADTENLILPLTSPATLAAQLKLASSAPSVNLQGIAVKLNPLSIASANYAAISDSQGNLPFSMPIRSGRYALDINPTSLPDGYILSALTLADQPVSPNDFEITTSAPLKLVLSKTAATIQAKAVDEDARPQQDVYFTLHPTNNSIAPRMLPTNEEGMATFKTLPPGKYKLFLWSQLNEDLWQDPDYLKNFEAQSTTIEVQAGESKLVARPLPRPKN